MLEVWIFKDKCLQVSSIHYSWFKLTETPPKLLYFNFTGDHFCRLGNVYLALQEYKPLMNIKCRVFLVYQHISSLNIMTKLCKQSDIDKCMLTFTSYFSYLTENLF